MGKNDSLFRLRLQFSLSVYTRKAMSMLTTFGLGRKAGMVSNLST